MSIRYPVIGFAFSAQHPPQSLLPQVSAIKAVKEALTPLHSPMIEMYLLPYFE
jgi:hypothetical protein